MEREKGDKFMRLIAKQLREACPGLDTRKGHQTRKGDDEPDVWTSGIGVWLECKHRNSLNPVEALEQAELESAKHGGCLLPIAVTRKTGARSIVATMRYRSLLVLDNRHWNNQMALPCDAVVSLPWEAVLAALATHWECRWRLRTDGVAA